jgi:hypothetical protein
VGQPAPFTQFLSEAVEESCDLTRSLVRLEALGQFLKLVHDKVGPEGAGSVENVVGDCASFVGPALGDQDGDQHELGEGAAAGAFAWPEANHLFGLTPSGVELAKLAEAAGGLSGEGCFVEVADPWRAWLGRADAEYMFGLAELISTWAVLGKRGMASCLHGVQLGGDTGMGAAGVEPVVALPRVGDGLLGPLRVVGQVAEAGEDVAAELMILANCGHAEGALEMLFG